MSVASTHIGSFVFPSLKGTLPHGFATSGRGEERCLLNLACYLSNLGYCVYINAKPSSWKNGESLPANVYLISDLPDGCPYITITYASENPSYISDSNCVLKLWYRFDCKKYLLDAKTVIAHTYNTGIRYNCFMKTYQKNKFVFLPYVVPYLIGQDCKFDNKILLWSLCGGLYPCSTDSSVPKAVIEWVSSKLEQCPNMEFYVLTGALPQISERYLKEIASSPLFLKYLHRFKERVHLVENIPYDSVLSLIQRSKMVINVRNFDHSFGGAPIEAALAGIPTVNYNRNGHFSAIPGALETAQKDNIVTYIKLLDRLFLDRSYFFEMGEKYREHAEKLFSGSYTVSQMKQICAAHGISLLEPTSA